MNLAPDYISNAYGELGLGPAAGLEEVRSAYRRLAKQCHPDLNSGQGEAMSRLNRAYQILKKHLETQSQARPYRFAEFHPGPGEFSHAAQANHAKPHHAQAEADDQSSGPFETAFSARARTEQAVTVAPAKERVKGPGWRLVGLEERDGRLVYLIEIDGSPSHLSLPVRRLKPCGQCRGQGQVAGHGGWRLCPTCGGRGEIALPALIEVEMPPDWRHGQVIGAMLQDQEVLVELRRAGGKGGA